MLKTSPRALALHHSAVCFFNSLAREWAEATVQDSCLRLPLTNGRTLLAPLTKVSRIGRHQYEGRFFIENGGERTEISFLEAAEAVSSRLADHFKTTPEALATFLKRVGNSVDNIELVLTKRGLALNGLQQHSRVDFRSAEQALFVGHNFHPTPKSRDEFTREDFTRYSSEMGGEFALAWFLVKPELLHVQTAASFDDEGFARDLFLQAFPEREDLRRHLSQGYQPLPVHPWQHGRLIERRDVRAHLASGALIDAGLSSDRWSATTSTRSVHNPKARYMLKFSLSVRLTNSLRHLLPAEVVRGLQVADVFSTRLGRRFREEHPEFGLLLEPAFAALKDENGRPMTESVVVWRENPFRDSVAFQDIVLATLVQDHPSFGENLALRNVRRDAEERGLSLQAAALEWFEAYLKTVVRPLIRAQAHYGVLLGAHQQNLVLRLEGHRPVGAFFRDCQGTGYSRHGFNLFSRDVALLSEDNGNVLTDKMGNALFSYYLIVNSTLNVIASLAAKDWISEEELLARLRDCLTELRAENPADPSCLDALLREKTLPQKGNFLCAFRGLNENTSEDPLALYGPIANPIVSADFSPTSTALKPISPVTYRSPLTDKDLRAEFDGKTLSVQSDDGDFSASVRADGNGVRLSFTGLLPAAKDLSLLTALELLFGHHETLAFARVQGDFARDSVLPSLFRSEVKDGLWIGRAEFFQTPQLWLPKNVLSLAAEAWTVTNDVRHPLRPRQSGVLYRRYVPRLGKTLSFRLIDLEKDLDLFHAWQNQNRVADFWELGLSKEALADFLRKGLSDRHSLPTILEADGKPVGYFEMYWVAEDRLGDYCEAGAFDRGFHFLIGDEGFLGFKNTDAVLKSVTHFLLLDDPRTRTLWAEPRADNVNVLKYVETFVAWRKLREFDFPHKRAALLECRRENFFLGGHL